MIHIQKFIERLQGHDARASKDFIMSMKDAKDLHADLTRLLLTIEHLRSEREQPKTEDEVITVEMDGGKF